MKEKNFALEFYGGFVAVGIFWSEMFWLRWVGSPDWGVQPWCFIVTVDNRGTSNGSIRVESGKKHTGRKRPTMAIRLGCLIENLFVKLSSQVFYRDSHTKPYIFVGFPSH